METGDTAHNNGKAHCFSSKHYGNKFFSNPEAALAGNKKNTNYKP